jgi:hypothetical protein
VTIVRVCQRGVSWAAHFGGVTRAICVIWIGVSWAAIVIRSAAVEVSWERIAWAAVSGAIAAFIEEVVAC